MSIAPPYRAIGPVCSFAEPVRRSARRKTVLSLGDGRTYFVAAEKRLGGDCRSIGAGAFVLSSSLEE